MIMVPVSTNSIVFRVSLLLVRWRPFPKRVSAGRFRNAFLPGRLRNAFLPCGPRGATGPVVPSGIDRLLLFRRSWLRLLSRVLLHDRTGAIPFAAAHTPRA